MSRDRCDRIRGATAVLAAWILAGTVVLGCGAVLPSATLPPEILRSIQVRESLGLRSDEAWVIAVAEDPMSVDRDGIKVTPLEASRLDDAVLQKARELRIAFGLRADVQWIQAVLADPKSVETPEGLILAPDEAAAWVRRVKLQSELTEALNGYGSTHPEQWGGWYFESDTEAVALVTEQVDFHAANLRALVAPSAGQLDVRQVEWSLSELQAHASAVEADRAWFHSQGVRVTSVEADVEANRTVIEGEIAIPQSGVAGAIRSRFAPADWMSLRLRLDSSASLPLGKLRVTVLDLAGNPIVGVWCEALPDIVGAAGDTTFRDTDDQGQCRWGDDALLGATDFEIRIVVRPAGRILGSARVTVQADEEVLLTVRASAP